MSPSPGRIASKRSTLAGLDFFRVRVAVAIVVPRKMQEVGRLAVGNKKAQASGTAQNMTGGSQQNSMRLRTGLGPCGLA